MLRYDFEIKYKVGKNTGGADAFSCRLCCGAISLVTFQDWERLEDEVQRDSKLRGIMHVLLHGDEVLEGFQLKGERLYYRDMLVAPKDSIEDWSLISG